MYLDYAPVGTTDWTSTVNKWKMDNYITYKISPKERTYVFSPKGLVVNQGKDPDVVQSRDIAGRPFPCTIMNKPGTYRFDVQQSDGVKGFYLRGGKSVPL